MECNKEEAVRAREIAEKKMLNNDFQGARRVALKAKNIFPDLENISQLLAVCDVHCAAENKISAPEKDWYGILQLERQADDATIKKQYRKLALILHPDKNKFPGSEAAFKMIGEANKVLLDKSTRSLYDLKCKGIGRTIIRMPPTQQVIPNRVVRNSHGLQHKIPNVSASQSTGLNHRLPTQPDLSNDSQAFWTCCPFCNVKYRYYRDLINATLRCQKCAKPFIAYDLNSQGASPVSNWANASSAGSTQGSIGSQPSVSKQKQDSSLPSAGEFPFPHFRSDANSGRNLGSKFVPGTIEGLRGLKNKLKGNSHVNKEDGRDGVGMAKVSVTKANKKRGRKGVVYLSESSDNEEVILEEGMDKVAARHSSGQETVRRSSRQRHNVSYNETLSDDDFMGAPKRSRGSVSVNGKLEKEKSSNSENFEAEDNMNQINKNSFPAENCSLYDGDQAENHRVNLNEDFRLDPGVKRFNVVDDSESNPNIARVSEPELYNCPDPEFSDFEKCKDASCFLVDQIWACYDSIDGMPRFYAQIRKVFSPGFKLQITWLEAKMENNGELDWVRVGLPVSCGKFVHGTMEEMSDRLIFSHQIHFLKGRNRGSYDIYPHKGEIWALFKDWNIGWSSDPENHKTYTFEIVEILSDFGCNTGIKVGYLAKVKGFVSLFQRTCVDTFLIPYTELLRFSHRIPSFKMTGTEREGVPEGSFELDTASLPTNPNDLWQPEEVKMEAQSMKIKVNDSCSKSFNEKLKSAIGSENTSIPKERVDYKMRNELENETSEQFCESRIPIGITEISDVPLSNSNDAKEGVFYDFNAEKSQGKFRVGQIWALYSGKGRLPNIYVQIKKIATSPLKLYATSLEPCTLMQPNCCGIFKVQKGKPKIYSPILFSHIMAVNIHSNKFEIYPKKGEVWAIYKSCDADLLCSDLQNCEYDIVEVIKDDELSIGVSFLVQLPGLKSVFKREKRQGPNMGVLEIPRGKLSRFSHQVPAFQLTGEKDGSLRGYWELDPAAVPGHMILK